MNLRTCLLTSLLLLVAIPFGASAQEAPPEPPKPAAKKPAAAKPPETLPENVVARVYGRDITRDQLHARLTSRFQGTQRGQDVLDQMIEDVCVREEAKKRGVKITAEDARAYFGKVDAKVRSDSGDTKSLADVFREQDTDEKEFLELIREFLLRQELAKKDMGGRVGAGSSQFGIEGDLPTHRMKLWIKSLRARYTVETKDLPAGDLAVVAGQRLTQADFAASISARLPVDIVKGFRDDLIFEAAVEKHLADADKELGEGDIETELKRLRLRFAADPRVKGTGVTFDQFLVQTKGAGEESLRNDPNFRARLGLRLLLLKTVTQERIRAHWEARRDAYGDQAMLRQLFIPARPKGAKDNFGAQLQTFDVVHDIVLKAKVAALRVSGVAGSGSSKVPLADALAAEAKKLVKSREQRARAGETEVWTRARVESEKDLLKRVFEGKLGMLQGPIRSSVGYHLILVEERRPAPKFEEIQDKLREDVMRVEMADFRRNVHLGDDVLTSDHLAAPKPR